MAETSRRLLVSTINEKKMGKTIIYPTENISVDGEYATARVQLLPDGNARLTLILKHRIRRYGHYYTRKLGYQQYEISLADASEGGIMAEISRKVPFSPDEKVRRKQEKAVALIAMRIIKLINQNLNEAD